MKNFPSGSTALLAAVLSTAPVFAADGAPAPFTTPAEFTSQLWAAAPDIARPACLAWDERGRLWIAEAAGNAGEKRSQIKICEDANGDGQADKFTVFAEKLGAPAGMVFAEGGLIVIEGGQTLFLKDNDRDDRAEERVVLFSGWKGGAAVPLRYGFDNWIWGAAGAAGFDGLIRRERVKFGAGVFRFKADGSALEFVQAGGAGGAGPGFSEEGLAFTSATGSNANWHLAVPNRFYEGVSGWTARGTPGPETSSPAGAALYTARNFPPEFWNKAAFSPAADGRRVGRFQLEARGLDFIAQPERTFLDAGATPGAFLAAEVGPEGALWVVTDSGAGQARIDRVVWTKAAPAPALNLARAPSDHLSFALRNNNQLWRLHAQRLMVERGKRDFVPTLLAVARDPGVDELGLNTGAIHALWTLHGMAQRDHNETSLQTTAIALLRHPSAGVRRTAVLVLPRNPAAAAALLASGALADPEAQVRLAALLALTEMPPSDAAGAAVFAALQQEATVKERALADAATAAAARHDAGFFKALFAAPPSLSGPLGEAIRVVAVHYARRASAEPVLPILIALGSAPPAVAVPVLDAFAAHWPRDKTPVIAPAEDSKLVALAGSLPVASRSSLCLLAERWGKRAAFAPVVAATARELRTQIADAALPDATRAAAARRLISLADTPESIDAIMAQVTPLAPPALAGGLLGTLAWSRHAHAGTALIANLNLFTPSARRTAAAVIQRRPEWASELLQSIEKRHLLRTDLADDHWRQLKAHPDGAIVVRARELEKFTDDAVSDGMEPVIRKLLPIARRKGDAARGREVFAANCAACHQFDGQGTKNGPDLHSLGARSRQELLIDIIDPNRSVAADYRLWTIATKSGGTLSGRLAAETPAAFEVFDATSRKHVVPRADITALTPSDLSLMPTGYDKLPEGDLAALLEHLATARGAGQKPAAP